MGLTTIPPDAKWEECRLLIFSEFDRLDADVDAAHIKIRDLSAAIEANRNALTNLRLKVAGLSGLIAGAVELLKFMVDHFK